MSISAEIQASCQPILFMAWGLGLPPFGTRTQHYSLLLLDLIRKFPACAKWITTAIYGGLKTKKHWEWAWTWKKIALNVYASEEYGDMQTLLMHYLSVRLLVGPHWHAELQVLVFTRIHFLPTSCDAPVTKMNRGEVYTQLNLRQFQWHNSHNAMSNDWSPLRKCYVDIVHPGGSVRCLRQILVIPHYLGSWMDRTLVTSIKLIRKIALSPGALGGQFG